MNLGLPFGVTFASHKNPVPMPDSLRRILSVALIPALLFVAYNRVANWHLHILHNGIVIEHAHPFKNAKQADTPFQKHQHSDWELTILAALSAAAELLVAGILLGLLFRFLGLHVLRTRAMVVSVLRLLPLLRAPPVV